MKNVTMSMNQLMKFITQKSLEDIIEPGAFNIGTTNVQAYNEMLKGNYDHEKLSVKLVMMAPLDYLFECAKMQYGFFDKDELMDKYVKKHVKCKDARVYASRMKLGYKFPVPYIDYVSNMQDGRHRAYAAYCAGYDKIPVLVVKSL